MKIVDMIARALALNLGAEPDLKKMSAPELTELLKENDPDFGGEKPAKKSAATGPRDEGDPRTGKKVRCRIEVGSDNSEKGPVYACVNGYDFQAPRGKEVELDEGFVRHLQAQVITESVAVTDSKGALTGEVIEQDRPRFQVTILL